MLQSEAQITERLKKIKVTLTPEERNILGIDEEDIQSFAEEELELTPEKLKDAIYDIIEKAYKESPQFKKLVEEDQRKSPEKFPRSAKVLSRFLKHLKSILPADKSSLISADPFKQAHDLISLIVKKQPKKEELAKPAEKVDPLSENELQLFDLKPPQITPDITNSQVTRAIRYFMGILKTPEGKRIKNEETKDMDADTKKKYIYRLLKQIRNLKTKKGELKTFEKVWLGEDEDRLKKIVNSLVTKAPKKETGYLESDIYEVTSKAHDVATHLNRIIDMINSDKFERDVDIIEEDLKKALPKPSELEGAIDKIQSEVSKLNLNKTQISRLLETDPDSLNLTPAISEETMRNLKGDFTKLQEQIKSKGMSEERKQRLQDIKRKVKNVQELSAIDTKDLFESAENYLGLLNKHKSDIRDVFSKDISKRLGVIPKIIEMIGDVTRSFNNLTREERFRTKWRRGSWGRLFRKPKEAASYEDKYSKFISILREPIEEIKESAEEGGFLYTLRDKILSVMELPPESKLNPTGKDYREDPMAGEGPSLEEVTKGLEKIRSTLKKLSLPRKADEAYNIISWAASIPKHVSSGTKKASVSDIIRSIFQGSGVKIAGKAEPGWVIFRERLTKLGPKALKSFFDEPTMVQDFVEQMEREGLNKMLMKGGEEKPVEVVPAIQKIMQKAEGAKGDFENILGTKVMREIKSKHDIKKNKKNLDEAESRLKKLNEKLIELEKEYIPKIKKYEDFVTNPLKKIRDMLQEKKERRPEEKKEPRKREERPPVEKPKPDKIYSHNILSTLGELSRQYGLPHVRMAAADVPFKPTRGDKELVKPSDIKKQMFVYTKQLKDEADKIKEIDEPYKRAQRVRNFYEVALDRFKKHKNYIGSQIRGKLEADMQTVKSAEDFLRSEDSKELSDKARRQAQQYIDNLKRQINSEKEQIKAVENMVEQEQKMAENYRDHLEEVKKDLEDKEVEKMYEVAISPKMMPTKEEKKRIKERQKEKERVLGVLMDRDTYKKTMENLMKTYPKAKPVRETTGDVITKTLPSERYEEYKKYLEERRKKLEEINRITDIKNRLFQQKAFYENQLKRLSGVKQDLDKTHKRMEDLEQLLSVKKWIEEHKDEIDSEEYKKNKEFLNELTDSLGIEDVSPQRALAQERKALEQLKEAISDQEKNIPEYKKKIEQINKALQTKDPGAENPQRIQSEIMKLKNEKNSVRSRADMTQAQRVAELKRIDEEINRLEEKLKLIREKSAAEEDKSPFEITLETKAAPAIEKVKKLKDWGVVENFFDTSRKILRTLEERKEEEKIPESLRKTMDQYTEQLKTAIPFIDKYMKQIVDIAGEKVPIKDIAQKLDDLLTEYSEAYTKIIRQRDETAERVKDLRQKIRGFESFYDSETGEYRDFTEEEKDVLKDVFWRMLYRYLDYYWAQRVGKDIAVFGPRDTEWYNNVYKSFKNISEARSNRKLMNLLNKYKEETRSDFDDMANRLKSEELIKKRDDLVKRYRGLGEDPSKSETIKDLNTRISQLKKQEDQINRVFDEMVQAVHTSVHEDVKESVEKNIKGDKPEAKADLEKKKEEAIKDVVGLLEEDISSMTKADEALAEVQNLIQKAESDLEAKKEASYRNHSDFNLRILYSKKMQDTIYNILEKEMN